MATLNEVVRSARFLPVADRGKETWSLEMIGEAPPKRTKLGSDFFATATGAKVRSRLIFVRDVEHPRLQF